MITRRRFLYGLGGAAVALPFLESVRWARRASAGPSTTPVYSMFIRQGNGCQQGGYLDEPDRFWPSALGPLSKTSLTTTDANQAVSVLADYADKLTLVRGTHFAFPGAGCGHSGGLNQVLTAANITGSGNTSLATGESVDWFLGQRVNPQGVEPLTLMSGPQQAYIAHGLSYSGPAQLRGARNNPFAVYTELMGLSGSPEYVQQIAMRRRSVNDLVRTEMQELLAMPDLSQTDRQRLDMHFQSIRDLEVAMTCTLPDNEVQAMQQIGDMFEANSVRVQVADYLLELAALAFACDATRVGTIQLGEGNDQTQFVVDGVLQNTYHRISHRIDSDGSQGTPIPNADVLHHKIDIIMAGIVKRFLDKLSAYPGPSGGTLLDDSVVLWTNDLANGPPHSYDNIPQVLIGGAGGFLKTGQYIDARGVTHNQLLNTIINAVGVRKSDGSYYDSFGDPSLSPGVIAAIIK